MSLPDSIHLRQQQPFRYADTVEALDASTRCAVIGLRIEPGRGSFDFRRASALPGVLLVEPMAQACGILLRHISTGEDAGVLVGVEYASIPEELAYPVQVSMRVQLITAASPIFVFDACAMTLYESPPAQEAGARIQIRSNRQLS